MNCLSLQNKSGVAIEVLKLTKKEKMLLYGITENDLVAEIDTLA